MKVMLIGAPGSGKSTLARQLAQQTGWPLLALDRVWHAMDYSAAAKVHFITKQTQFMAAHQDWLIDGNFTSTIPLRLASADLVVWLRVPSLVAPLRLVRRSLAFHHDPQSRPDMAPGFQEHLDRDYLDFLTYAVTFRSRVEPRLAALLSAAPITTRIRIIQSASGKSALIGELTSLASGQVPRRTSSVQQ
ncbi:AAA family ATPase [Lacticaseibacillus camelliae]|nr:AAA family ATPase [Lacticaseibacillus camelliae]